MTLYKILYATCLLLCNPLTFISLARDIGRCPECTAECPCETHDYELTLFAHTGDRLPDGAHIQHLEVADNGE